MFDIQKLDSYCQVLSRRSLCCQDSDYGSEMTMEMYSHVIKYNIVRS